MRKLIFLAILIVLTFGILPAATAAPLSDLTALARYYPADTFMFASMRSDEAFIDEVDTLIAQLTAKFPEGSIPPDSNFRALLDWFAMTIIKKDFQEGLRSWVGDTVAIGIPSLEIMNSRDLSILIAVSVSDRDAAEAFVEELFAQFPTSPITPIEGDGYTLYSPDGASTLRGGLLVSDEVLLLTLSGAGVELTDMLAAASGLNANEEFDATLGLLPTGDYHAVGYVDTSQLLSTSGAGPLANLVELQSAGLTMLDDRTLAIDTAVNVGDLGMVSELGFEVPGINAIAPAFAANIPSNATFVFHSTNIAALIESSITDITKANEMAGVPPAEEMAATLNTQFSALTGLDLQDDVLSWMGGDYAIFGTIDSEALLNLVLNGIQNDPLLVDEEIREQYISGELSYWAINRAWTLETLPVGFGMVVEATDPAKAQAFAGKLGEMIGLLAAANPSLKITQEEISGVNVTVITVDFYFTPTSPVPLHIVIGANDNVFFMATRAEATSILSGDGTLANSSAYTEAGAYLLSNPSALIYIDGQSVGGGGGALFMGALSSPGGYVYCSNSDAASEQCQQLRRDELVRMEEYSTRMSAQIPMVYDVAMSLISSSTLSATSTADGDSIARFVITIGE